MSKVLGIADAIVALIVTLVDPDAVVTRTYHGTRYDEITDTENWYVVPREDATIVPQQGGDRSRDPLKMTFSIVLAQRVPANLRTVAERDAWVDTRVDLMTTVRDALDNPREFSLPAWTDSDLSPIDTTAREVADLDVLNQQGIFLSEFQSTLREDL